MAQLALQQPDDAVFRALQQRPMQRLLTWRNSRKVSIRASPSSHTQAK